MGRPAVDTLNGSRYPNMKELRAAGSPFRLLFAFDKQRNAIMLAGGSKASHAQRAYRDLTALADKRFARHLQAPRREILWDVIRAGTRSDERAH